MSLKKRFYFFSHFSILLVGDNILFYYLTVCSMSAVKEMSAGNGSSALTVALVYFSLLLLFPPVLHFPDCV